MNSALTPRTLSKAQPQSKLCDTLESRIPDKADASAVLRLAIRDAFGDRIALVSSFGTESALLLSLAAEVDPAIPVIFLDTGKLFPETLEYRETLIDRLGLTDVRLIRPDAEVLATEDPAGGLWRHHADRCCDLRKAIPLQTALHGFDAWITGRKRFQSAARRQVGLFETDASGRIKVNPLAFWTPERITAEFERRDLPHHPLEAFGFLSVGCTTCTVAVTDGGDRRAGRWPGQAKTECGIHSPVPAFA